MVIILQLIAYILGTDKMVTCIYSITHLEDESRTKGEEQLQGSRDRGHKGYAQQTTYVVVIMNGHGRSEWDRGPGVGV